jgi:hypothetical protein
VRAINNLSDAQIVLKELLDWKDTQISKAKDQRGLQIKNAGDATDPTDLVTLRQLKPASLSIKKKMIDVRGPAASMARPGVVSFSPKRTNYGEISIQNIVVRDNPDPQGPLQLQIYALYVDEVEISQYATISGIAFDPTKPDKNNDISISANEHDVGVQQWGPFKSGDLCIINDIGKYEIFLLTSYDVSWMIQRHWQDDSPGKALFGSWQSAHSGDKKVFKVKVKHCVDGPRTANVSLLPPGIIAPDKTGGTSFVIPDYTIQLPHSCIVAIMVAATNAGGTGPYTIYNCAQSYHPILPGIRTMDGSSYTLPQFIGPIFNGLTMPIPWTIQVWASLRCAYAYVGKACSGDSFGGTGITKIQLQIHFLDDPLDVNGNPIYGLISNIIIGSGALTSWDGNDPPTIYNNPYYKEKSDETSDEHDWPQWSHPLKGIDRYHRSIEGDALLRWIVIDNGSIAPTATLDGSIDDRINAIKFNSYSGGFQNGDYIQIDDEKLLIQYDGGTTTVIALRGVLGTIPAVHSSGVTVSDISAGGAVDLSVVGQT